MEGGLGLDRTDYEARLLEVLRQQTDAAVVTLRNIAAVLPPKVRGLALVVYPAQDPDGSFDIMVHLDGPDLYVLNKAIESHRCIFQTRIVDGRRQPDLPHFDPFDQPFSVNDAIVDAAMVWLQEVWTVVGGFDPAIPATVAGDEGYGTKPRIALAQPSIQREISRKS